MGGGAWPFLVGGVSCLVDSVNERDLCRIIGGTSMSVTGARRTCWVASNRPGKHSRVLAELVSDALLYETNTENVLEVIGKNRSVMPFDVLGCTRATMTMSASNHFERLVRKHWQIL